MSDAVLSSPGNVTYLPTPAPTTTIADELLLALLSNGTETATMTTEPPASSVLVAAEEEHAHDAVTTLLLNVTIIACLMLAYYVKRYRVYHLPESAGALMVGIVVGGIARLSTDNLVLFEFSPEVFFFVLLPPIIFEAGYSLNRKDFFDNIGAITLFAMVGTIISTFVVGLLSWCCGKTGLIKNIDETNPMEALLFGALISAVDPVATLSIMGNADLRCDPLLYSLVFGESVLNDAIAISLFKVFAVYYDPAGPDWSEANIPAALVSFMIVSALSIVVGVGLGLAASAVYKHTELSTYPNLETSLLFSFCYLCYATGEALGLSGIMALFFQGIVLSHYNAYNLSSTAHVASEQLFATLATIAETAVFLYMGMGVFTGRFANYDPLFSFLALLFCLLGRALNIFPLSWLANMCRSSNGQDASNSIYDSTGSIDSDNAGGPTGPKKITLKMQCVLWFAGLRGAIAFALAMNMPGPNREVYATATLTICIFTTVVCGGLTDKILTHFNMKQPAPRIADDGPQMNRVTFTPSSPAERRGPDSASEASQRVYRGAKRMWKQFDDQILIPNFGGPTPRLLGGVVRDHLGNYELSTVHSDDGSNDGMVGFAAERAHDHDGTDKNGDGAVSDEKR